MRSIQITINDDDKKVQFWVEPDTDPAPELPRDQMLSLLARAFLDATRYIDSVYEPVTK